MLDVAEPPWARKYIASTQRGAYSREGLWLLRVILHPVTILPLNQAHFITELRPRPPNSFATPHGESSVDEYCRCAVLMKMATA